ncbi:ParA family protein [Tunicatimonas pelagia]|uniref:ParA family protein n=1 Tax=Tunicatimonas pelagia TaxID=931531 RepID=UPI00266692BD|nr:ParA family protein [Tunicatimonas pelagia]WKN46537.1 ParA family protein [Tunicatimonas pelagia]
MTLILGVVSQKGGVGKSTIARTIAKAYAQAEWNVLIADLDVKQGTTFEWNSRRLAASLKPELQVQQFSSVVSTLKLKDSYDLIVYDGAPHSTSNTLAIAQQSNLIILPTGGSLDDLRPQIRLAHELVKKGIDRKHIAFVLSRIDASEAEHTETTDYLSQTPYQIISSYIPEKRAFRNALNEGKTLTDTSFKSLNQKAEHCIQSIIDYVSKVS